MSPPREGHMKFDQDAAMARVVLIASAAVADRQCRRQEGRPLLAIVGWRCESARRVRRAGLRRRVQRGGGPHALSRLLLPDPDAARTERARWHAELYGQRQDDRGFALFAYPAEYGNSGVMTFLVNHFGTVYQKDLGDYTMKLVNRLMRFDPDQTWKKVSAEER